MFLKNLYEKRNFISYVDFSNENGKNKNSHLGITLESWLNDNNLSIDIWKNKYQYDNESFSDWIYRISNGNKLVSDILINKKFMFGGRILANRHVPLKSTLSNCYVLKPPSDSIESIYETAGKLARTYSYGGGCGIDISNLAPNEARVNNSAKKSSGAISFMDLYSLTTGLIGQNGRRGALMISLSCKHPDLLEFIKIKSNLDKVNYANISIRIFNDFIDAVIKDKSYPLEFYRPETNHLTVKNVSARKIFRSIAETNWDYGEPGFLFWDRIKSWSLLSNTEDFTFAGVNPCGEEPLPAGGSCLLGSINLSEFVINPFTDKAYFDFAEFKRVVMISTYALNDVLDEGLPLHPLKEQRESVAKWRQIGLGIMGLADMLIKLGLRYGSKEAIKLCDEMGLVLINNSVLASSQVAKFKGSYDGFKLDNITSTDFYKNNIFDSDTIESVNKYGLRNSQLLTIAPTGSISTMLGISGGIEPLYLFSFNRKTISLNGKETIYKVFVNIVKEYMDLHGIKDEKDLPPFFVNSSTINYKERIDMQSILQKHVDAAISSTLNVPKEFTIEDVEGAYLYAYEKGLKGVTLFRTGCKRAPILSPDDDKDEQENVNNETEKDDNVFDKVLKDLNGNKKTSCDYLKLIIKIEDNKNDNVKDDSFNCPECGTEIEFKEGCTSCPNCGWGKCSV